MALDTNIYAFSIDSAVITKVTTNTSDTYAIEAASRIELPDLKSCEVTLKTVTKNAEARNIILDSFTIIQAVDIKFGTVKIPLAALALINGAKLTNDTNVAKVSIGKNDVPNLFKLEFKTNFVNGEAADFHTEIFAIKGFFNITSKSDDYFEGTFEGTGYARNKTEADGNQLFLDFTANKTATAIQ